MKLTVHVVYAVDMLCEVEFESDGVSNDFRVTPVREPFVTGHPMVAGAEKVLDREAMTQLLRAVRFAMVEMLAAQKGAEEAELGNIPMVRITPPTSGEVN